MNLQTLLTHILQEQVDLNRVNQAYLKTINAVAGLGTDVPAVLIAIKMLKSSAEFDKYKLKFKDKKTGYDSFQNMINGEYDTFNASDILSIIRVLQKINVYTIANMYTNNAGQDRFRVGSFKFNKTTYQPLPIISTADQKKWLTLLPKAVLWWKNWLSNPITQKKVQSNWDKWYLPGSVSVKYIFSDYFNMLDSLKIKFYDELDPINWSNITDTAYAFVNGFRLYSDNTIYINLTQNDPEPFDTLIHEIQHIIYNIKPLNPEEKIRDIFVTKNTKRATPNSIESSLRPTNNDYNDQLLRQSSNVIKSMGLDMTATRLTLWKLDADNYKRPAYVCQATEKMSNIMSIRSHFKLKPGQNITIEMLKPYIEGKKKNTDISWIILCWAKNGFPNLNKMINRINTLAVNNTGTNRGPNVA